MSRHFLQLSYLGTAYHGWQRQPNAGSVQQAIEEALAKILRSDRIPIVGCGRTDTGVHAAEFYAHFDVSNELPIDLVLKLNGLLPDDIAIQRVIPVAAKAHARFHASSREYVYRLHLGKDPFARHYSRQIYRLPDIEGMIEAAAALVTADDFTSFARVHTDVKTHICDVHKAEWTLVGPRLTFTISADRFLRNMVRAIVGTLLDVGKGKRSVADFSAIIAAKDRKAAGSSAPAIGLSLNRVDYPYIQRP